MKNKSLIICFSFVAVIMLLFSCKTTDPAVANTATSSSAQELIEGFNEANSWKAVANSWGDGDCSTKVELSTEWTSEGSKSLKGYFGKTGEAGGAATFYTEAINVPDVSPYESLYFDVCNPLEVPLQVSFAITTGGAWEWYESNVFDILPGETKNLCVDFYTGSLKSALSGWQFTSNLGDSDDVRRLAIKFQLPGNTEGFVYVDNIRLQ